MNGRSRLDKATLPNGTGALGREEIRDQQRTGPHPLYSPWKSECPRRWFVDRVSVDDTLTDCLADDHT